MTPNEKVFYQQLGQRIATFRKAQNLTQIQLAETLGVAQQTLAHYEGGRLRVSAAMLAAMADALVVSAEELLDQTPNKTKRKRGPASVLQRQIDQVSQLPRTQQKFVMQMLDTVLNQRPSA